MELLFGLLMALSFTGAVSVAESGREQLREMFIAALGCNLAWGLVDAVMYLIRTVIDRGRVAHARPLRFASAAERSRRAARDRGLVVAGRGGPGLADRDRGDARPHSRAALQCRREPSLAGGDLLAALAIFLLVVARHLSGRSAVRADAGCRRGEERIARDRARDAVPRRARPRSLCRLRQPGGPAC